jgi:hypothetical protein
MAKMIPPHWQDGSPNSEQKVFQLLKTDPATKDWIVLHSLNLKQTGRLPYGEIDFVVLIPGAGVLCIEVKGGFVACKDGIWTSTDGAGSQHLLKRSPFKQAQDGMHEMRRALEEKGVNNLYKVPFGFVVIFTDVDAIPLDIGVQPWEVIDRVGLRSPISAHLLRAAKNQRTRLRINTSPPEPQPSTLKHIRETLRPDFEKVVARSTLVNDSERHLIQLTEEQYEVLDLLDGNSRCLFEGAAGTGKTLLALEFARRCARSGDRVLLICFNKLLGGWFADEIKATSPGINVTSGTFYKCLRDAIITSPIATEFLEAEKRPGDLNLFDEIFPLYGQLTLDALSEKFDVVVMDEAQDLLRDPILTLIDTWVVGGLRAGRWALFGDFHRQAIYKSNGILNPHETMALRCPSYARARLTQNCRNTRRIGEETALLSGFESPPYRMGQMDGVPVDYQDYVDGDSQRSALERVLSRIALEANFGNGDVVILSKYRLEQSAAGTLTDTRRFKIISAGNPVPKYSRIPTFLFATAQAFKGMESKVIVLCDVDRIDGDEDRSLLYVAMSRARSLLAVLLHTRTKPAINEAFARRMSELWR